MSEKSFEIALDQGSPDWHRFRRKHRMASTAAVVMGCAPSYWAINTPELLRRYNDGADFPPSAFANKLFAAAHEAEARVRDEMNVDRDGVEDDDMPPLDYQQRVFLQGKYAASLDGYETGAGRDWLEVKMVNSPASETWKAAQSGRALPHHYWQLVHQAYCVPESAAGVHFVVTTRGDERIFLWRSREDLMKEWPKLQEAWDAFAESRDPVMPPDGIADAERYARLHYEYELAAASLKEAKAALLKHGPRDYPGVLKVTRYTTRGRIDYRAAAEAHYGEGSEALEVYRGMPAEGHRITLAKEKDDEKEK